VQHYRVVDPDKRSVSHHQSHWSDGAMTTRLIGDGALTLGRRALPLPCWRFFRHRDGPGEQSPGIGYAIVADLGSGLRLLNRVARRARPR
jgi:hypothetical protein